MHGVSGVWKDLTDNVNFMADNLTSQVRNIAQVATAVANGDLSKKIDVDARGEILELKTTINTMVDTLSSFSSEVTRVAREVGSEGQLGGQARVEGVYGTWKRPDDQRQRAGPEPDHPGPRDRRGRQRRRPGRHVPLHHRGDARGEVAELKDNINLMVANLRETTRAKDWLESNLARIAGLMQGHRDLVEVADLILRELTPLVNAQYGAFFLADPGAEPGEDLEFIAGYGTGQRRRRRGAAGSASTPRLRAWSRQAAAEKKRILIEDAPPDYITINSGLGAAPPASVVILPILFEDQAARRDRAGLVQPLHRRPPGLLRPVREHHRRLDQHHHRQLPYRVPALASPSACTSRSSRSSAQDELQRSNAELEEKAALLATSSQYKSEFLANMSHELRTPLNSLLILARLLADNPDGHLSDQEVEFADTIHRSGSDLLQLINDILDLSKIEAGRMDVRPKKLPLIKLLDYVHATFRPITLDRGLAFEIAVGEDVPREMYSDEQRLQQILRNLLSNAMKFTSSGGVELRVERASTVRTSTRRRCARPTTVIASPSRTPASASRRRNSR